MAKQWFEQWFDSPYYHLLYRHRDESEAESFLKTLINSHALQKVNKVLDLACGRGRHSRVLARMGYEVYGLDYSPNNIKTARELSQPSLEFAVHDMRDSFPWKDFDLICNLFTSFGYFDSDEEHRQTLVNCYESLLPGGHMILDFLNTHWVAKNAKPHVKKTANGIEFSLSKEFQDGFLVNQIRFEVEGKQHHYQERVRAFEKDELISLFVEVGFEISAIFGSYQLAEFDKETSDRVIILAKK